MVLKVSHYNELRAEKENLKTRYTRLEQVAQERDIQVASLGSLAGEVSSLYGLKSDPNMVTASSENVRSAQVVSSLDQLGALKASALVTKLGELVDRWLVVPEPRLKTAIPELASSAKVVAEGAGALSYAALKQLPPGPTTVAVISGGNIDSSLLASLLS